MKVNNTALLNNDTNSQEALLLARLGSWSKQPTSNAINIISKFHPH